MELSWITWYWATLISIPFGTIIGLIFAFIPLFCASEYTLENKPGNKIRLEEKLLWGLSAITFLGGYPFSYCLWMGYLS